MYTIARAEKSSFSSSFFGYFNGEACKAVDKYTVDIVTYEPFAPFFNLPVFFSWLDCAESVY